MTQERQWKLPNTKHRRKIRYRLFRISQGNDVGGDDLKEYIESQFKPNMTWNNFTFVWDIGVSNPLQVITEDQWTEAGGTYEYLTGALYPAAFTRQQV